MVSDVPAGDILEVNNRRFVKSTELAAGAVSVPLCIAYGELEDPLERAFRTGDPGSKSAARI
jgi:hypothetical protein